MMPGERSTAQLATPTLARLYLGQGRQEQAQHVVQSLLEQAPENGQALALAHRCQLTRLYQLHTRWTHGKLVLSWDLANDAALEQKAQLRIHIIDASATCATGMVELREIQCRSVRGKVTIPLNCQDGACTSYLHAEPLDEHPLARSQRILAVGSVHRWSNGQEHAILRAPGDGGFSL